MIQLDRRLYRYTTQEFEELSVKPSGAIVIDAIHHSCWFVGVEELGSIRAGGVMFNPMAPNTHIHTYKSGTYNFSI